jgi:aspartyl-tRNA(Asn)/glutamyl-tRNA(Gln) amidotransferase subunit A
MSTPPHPPNPTNASKTPAPAPLAAVAEARDAVRARTASATELTRAALARIDALNPRLNALTQVFHDYALQQAAALDARLARGEAPPPLAGVTIALKDNICLEHGFTTCASRLLAEYRSPFSATVARRLLDAGAIIVGKANCDEFAMGSSTEHSCHGPTRNPWDVSRVPGGSSGGSAAAVAAGLVHASLGSDTGGSIRQPASLCGIVGHKPTYGRVSRRGLVAYASSLDQIGPFARSADDAALILAAIAGHDPLDSTSDPHAALDLAATLPAAQPKSLTLGIPTQARSHANSPGTAAALEAAAAAFRALGATIIDIDLPHSDHAIAAYYLIATAEASSNLARFDGVRFGRRAPLRPGEGLEALYARSRAEGLGTEVQRRIMLGTHALSSGYYDAYYLTALKARRLIKRDFDLAFAKGCHAVLMPASPGPAFKLGEKLADPLAMYLEDIYTVGVNLAGLPAITVPAGFEPVGPTTLPIGMQLIGPPRGDESLLHLARLFQSATTHHLARPPEGGQS